MSSLAQPLPRLPQERQTAVASTHALPHPHTLGSFGKSHVRPVGVVTPPALHCDGSQAHAEPPQAPDEGPDEVPERHTPLHQPQPARAAQAEQLVAALHPLAAGGGG